MLDGGLAEGDEPIGGRPFLDGLKLSLPILAEENGRLSLEVDDGLDINPLLDLGVDVFERGENVVLLLLFSILLLLLLLLMFSLSSKDPNGLDKSLLDLGLFLGLNELVAFRARRNAS